MFVKETTRKTSILNYYIWLCNIRRDQDCGIYNYTVPCGIFRNFNKQTIFKEYQYFNECKTYSLNDSFKKRCFLSDTILKSNKN